MSKSASTSVRAVSESPAFVPDLAGPAKHLSARQTDRIVSVNLGIENHAGETT